MPKGIINTFIRALLVVAVLLSGAGVSKTLADSSTVVRGLLHTADNDGDGNFEIYQYQKVFNGTSVTSQDVPIIAGANTSWLNPKLSPDGRTVVVTRLTNIGNNGFKEVVTFSLASPSQVNVVVGYSKPPYNQPPYNQYVYEDPNWSFDGTRIVYKEVNDKRSGYPYKGDIVEVDLSGGSRNVITTNPVFQGHECSVPSYSRNDGGKRIAFSCTVPDATGGNSHEQIFVVDHDTKTYIQLTTSPEKHWYPAWSPLSNKVAYVLHDLGEGAELHLFDLGKTFDRKIVVPQEQGIGPYAEFVDPAFSPTGRLAFSVRWTIENSPTIGKFSTYKIFDLDATLTTLSALVTPQKKDMFGADYGASQSPTATPQTVTLNQNGSTPFTLGASGGQTPYTFSIVTAPTHGTTSGTLPNLAYSRAANYFGSDFLRFQVRDATGETAQADITLTPAIQNSRITLDGWYNDGWDATSHQVYLANTDLFSDLNPFWFNLGTAETGSGRSDTSGSIYLRTAYSAREVADIHARGAKCVPAIADGEAVAGVYQINAIFRDPTARQKLIDNMVNTAVAMDFDGWDLDFENGAAENGVGKAAYTLFVKDLAAALQTKGKVLDVTIGAFENATQESYWIMDLRDLKGLNNVRYFKIMAYDKCLRDKSGRATIQQIPPIGEIEWVKSCLDYMVVNRGLPASKVLLGIPNYSYVWEKSNSTGKYELQSLQPYNVIISKPGVTVSYQSDIAESTATWNNGLDFATVSDANSVAARLNLISPYGLKGAAFYVLGNEDPSIYTAVRTVVTDKTPPAVTITAPQNGVTLANLSNGIQGTASDNVGVGEVDVYLCHNKNDGTFEFWDGTKYVALSGGDPQTIAHLIATRNGTNWSQITNLPSGANLPAGSYTLFVSADDAAGNRSSARSDFTITVSGSNLWKAVDIATAPDNSTRLLWTMPSGTMATWTLNAAGGIVNQGVNYGPISDSAGHWNARRVSVGVDGKSRVLWTHTDGRAALWTLDSSGAMLNSSPSFGPIPGWSCVDVATSPADNTSRLLWVRTSGEMAVWNMNATGVLVNTGTNYGPVANWTARAVSIGGDGKTRVLWNNTSGEMTTWTLDNVGRFLSDNVHYGPISGWTCNDIATASDNTSRWLWNNTSGMAAVWKLDTNGVLQVSNGNTVHAEYGPLPGWNATALSVGADGKMRLIWNNVDGRAQVWIFDIPTNPGNGILVSPMFGPYASSSAPQEAPPKSASSVKSASLPAPTTLDERIQLASMVR